MGGAPCIAGTRIRATAIPGLLWEGIHGSERAMLAMNMLRDHPQLGDPGACNQLIETRQVVA